MRRLAAQRNPKAETRNAKSETRDTLTATATEPMEEGLAKKEKRPNGFFKRMSDDRLIEYTQEFMNGKGITTRKGLQKADSGLRAVLRRRNLLGQTIPESKQEGYRERRDWTAMTDLELIEFTQEVMNGKGITTRSGLEKADLGLYGVLRKRELLELVGFEEVRRKSRDWAMMSDKELVRAAQEFMKEKGITMRNGLAKADRGLHDVLRRRDLLAQIGFEEVNRNWAMMSDKELVKAAQEFVKGKRITMRRGLREADRGLHDVLRRRKLLGQVIPDSKQEGHRERRDWTAMTDLELIEFTQEFMNGKGITTRTGLYNADHGVYTVLRRRKLIDRVFAEIDEKRQEESLNAVCEALEGFGEDG